ncbi:hypothetical protein DRN72_01830 [Methanosarcinales archaeon]|nr:MAG: hypothetical protein DRN72_01830 [Methanosarcinales archaeon]
MPRVAICGYTNAGKSTLLNALVGKRCSKSTDQLFTTLSPITRSMRIDGRKVMLTDTVGFLEGLPHFMIEAFRSTFSEIYEADVILVVVDASESQKNIRRKLKTSHSTLFNDWLERPIITVFNKIDKAKCFELEPVRHLAPNPVIVSALNQEGIEDLKTKIGELLPPLETKEMILPMSPESLKKLSTLYKKGIVRELYFDSYIKVIYQTSHEEMKRIMEALDVR